jgi:Carboxypeptidase regulatory-like domain
VFCSSNIAIGVVVLALSAVAPTAAHAQTVGLLRGVVHDALGGAVSGATIRLSKDLIGFERESVSTDEGVFRLANLPLDSYELRVDFPGFKTSVLPVAIATSVPVEVVVVLELASQTSSVTVTPDASLVDPTSTGTRNTLSMARIEQLPAAVGSRGIESVLVTFPGFAQNANGAIHPRGAHNQMTFVVDGLPISDQLTGAFANALDAGIVQTVELMTGNVPAEFGSKVSGVAVITSRSGLGIDRRLAGDLMISAAGFNTWHGAAQMGGGNSRVGYFGSVTGMRTDRFLDQVSLDNLHNDGGFGRGFLRVDLQASEQDVLRVQGMGGRSSFEVANLRSQAIAGQDQRQTLADGAAWVSYLRTLTPQSTFESTVGYRAATARLDASPGDTPVTAAQRRRLATWTASGRYTRLMGVHTWRAGADVQRFPVREAFTMGITDSTFNDPLAPDFNPALLPHDLSRGGVPFIFTDSRAGWLTSGFAQSTAQWGPFTLTGGLRYDRYVFLVDGAQLQPRVGFAYRLPGAMGVLRGSFNRTYQTPPNENLLLSSSEEASALAPESVKEALGGSYKPIQPERQHVYELGYQRAIGRAATLDLSVYHKRSTDQQDNNNFFDTGIIFPTTLAAIRAEGAEMRVAIPNRRGISGTFSVTTGRAISSPPFTGGLFLGQDAVDLLSSGPFRIDHDQRLSLHGTLQYDAPGGLWSGASVRYDSGLVSNPSDPSEVAADPDFADLLPYVDLTADVPRVRPRTITDVAVGYDVMTSGHRTWGVQMQVTNLMNQTALYNFQSVFVGTRIVQPRTLAIRLKRFF